MHEFGEDDINGRKTSYFYTDIILTFPNNFSKRCGKMISSLVKQNDILHVFNLL